MQTEDDDTAQGGTAARHKARAATQHRPEQQRATDRNSNAPQTGTKKQDPKNKRARQKKPPGASISGKARQFPTSGALAIIVSVRALMIELLT